MNKYYVRFDLVLKKYIVIGPSGQALTKYSPVLNLEATRRFDDEMAALAFAEQCNNFDQSSEI